MSASELYHDLLDLQAEHARVVLDSTHDPELLVIAEVLADEIEEVCEYFVGAAVTEIASLRGEIDGRPQG